MTKKVQQVEVEVEPFVEQEVEVQAEPVILTEPEIRHSLYTLEYHDLQIGRLQSTIAGIERERNKPGGHLPDQLVKFEQQISQAQAVIVGQYQQIAGVVSTLEGQGRLPDEGTRERRRTDLSTPMRMYGGKQQS
jgi:hypothetical protein